MPSMFSKIIINNDYYYYYYPKKTSLVTLLLRMPVKHIDKCHDQNNVCHSCNASVKELSQMEVVM